MMTAVAENPPPAPDSSFNIPHSAFRHRDLWIVLALTLLGGVLRFSFLDRPPIWFDEAATFGRVAGTYQQLLTQLEEAGFGPLHYELYWWMKQHWTMTPRMMRLAPAICGTLMIPAMYWLARQLAGRRIALLSAALTTFSAYLLSYSRDGKMYMEFWFFCVLHMGSLLWWLRTRRPIPWWCWVISGSAMLGLHMLGAIVLAIELPMVLTTWWTRRRAWAKPTFFFLGIVLIALGPIGYYRYFNQYAQKIQKTWQLSGLQWIPLYNAGRTGPTLVGYASTAFLTGWEWPRERDYNRVAPDTLRTLKGACVTLAIVLGLGIFPWPRRWMGWASEGEVPDPTRAWRGWRVPLWLTIWLVLPAYAFYCVSMPDFASPRVWLNDAWESIRGSLLPSIGLPLIAIAWLTLCAPTWIGRLHRAGTFLLVVFVIGWLCQGFAVLYPWLDEKVHAGLGTSWKSHGSIWIPRYLGMCWPAFAIVLAALIVRLPTPPLRIATVALVALVNLAQFWGRVFAGTEPPVDLMVRDMLAAQSSDGASKMYYAIPRPAGALGPGTGVLYSPSGMYYFAVITGTPVAPLEVRQFVLPFNRRFPAMSSSTTAMARSAANDIRRNPSLSRLIVWDRPETGKPTSMIDSIGANWKLISERSFYTRDHWTWRDMFTCRRRIYERTGPAPAAEPTTRAATAPATRAATTRSSP
ncbi:MAG: glycosyltransferase family 39 protein [Tepidisphaeraceae bacterium]